MKHLGDSVIRKDDSR